MRFSHAAAFERPVEKELILSFHSPIHNARRLEQRGLLTRAAPKPMSCRRYSGLMFAALIIGHHFSISAL